ncbi:MAG: gamma-glutamylcyclotransferase family protein [Chloroflexota bacterium]
MIDYFAYGSNMDNKEVQKCSVELRNPRVARLDGYKLRFNYCSSKRKSGAANIMVSEGDSVYGLLMELNEKELKRIRCKEGCKNPDTTGLPNYYDEIRVTVEKQEDSELVINVVTYKVTNDKERKENVPPKESYMKLIIDNAEKYGFPSKYISFLKSIETIPS